MLTLGQAARLGTVPATGPAVRHATPDVTDAELHYWVGRAEQNSVELKSAPEDIRAQAKLLPVNKATLSWWRWGRRATD
jgi:hypothetical protein